MHMREHNNTPYACMIILQSIVYGVFDPISKLAYQDIPVYSFLTVRYIISTLFMLLIWRKQIIRELSGVHIKKYILPSGCIALSFVLSNAAISLTAATNVAFLRSLSGLIAPLLLLIFYRVKYTLKSALLQAIILIGLYLLCAKGGLSHFGLGEVFALAAATLMAGSLVFGQDSLQYISALTLSCVQAASAIIICAVFGSASGSFVQTDWNAFFKPVNAFALVYGALGCTVGGYMLQNTALEHLPSRIVGILQCTYPVIAAIVSFIILGEKLSLAGVIGAAIIIACVCLESALKQTCADGQLRISK